MKAYHYHITFKHREQAQLYKGMICLLAKKPTGDKKLAGKMEEILKDKGRILPSLADPGNIACCAHTEREENS